MNILDVLARSKAGVVLTPTERAMLKAMQGVLINFLALLLPYLNDILAGKVQIDYVHLVEVLAVAMVLSALSKYISAVSPEQQEITKKLEAEADELTRNEAGTIINAANVTTVSAARAGYSMEQVGKAFSSQGQALASQPLVLPGTATSFPIVTNVAQDNLTVPPAD